MSSTSTTWSTDSLTKATASSSIVDNVSFDGTLTVAGATQLNSTLTIGTDVDDTDRTITFGHGTLKSIMGIDDSQDVFAINTDASFQDDNDLELDASGNLSINGDFSLDGNDISYGGFGTSDGDAYLKMSYELNSTSNHPTLNIFANNTYGQGAGDGITAHHTTYFDLMLQSDGFSTLKSINSKLGGVLIKHDPDSEGVNSAGNIGIFVNPIGSGTGHISIGGKKGSNGGWEEVESKCDIMELHSSLVNIYGAEADVSDSVELMASFDADGGGDGTSRTSLYGQVYFYNNAGTEIGSLGSAGALQIDGDITIGGNDIRNSQGEITLGLDDSQNVTVGASLTVTNRFACNGQSPAAAPDWTVSNKSGTPRDLDANGTLAEIGDRVAQLVDDLISIGLLQ